MMFVHCYHDWEVCRGQHSRLACIIVASQQKHLWFKQKLRQRLCLGDLSVWSLHVLSVTLWVHFHSPKHADAFIQSDLQCIKNYTFWSVFVFPGFNPWPFAPQTQCVTTELYRIIQKLPFIQLVFGLTLWIDAGMVFIQS